MKLSRAALCLNCEAVFPIGTPCPDCASEKWVAIQVWLDKKILIVVPPPEDPGAEQAPRSPSPADQRRLNQEARQRLDAAAATLHDRSG